LRKIKGKLEYLCADDLRKQSFEVKRKQSNNSIKGVWKVKYKHLDSLWKELLFAMSGFGPTLLMIIMGAYFTDAINPSALPIGSAMAIDGTIFILPAIFPILITLAKMIDGIVDIPLANMTDRVESKRGTRRLPILIGIVPMIASYILTWTMVSTNQLFMTIWIVLWSIVFFVSYSNNSLSFLGSISTVSVDSNQRLRVSIFKAFFDTIAYSLTYALVPVIISDSFRIDKLAIALSPLLLTILIPVFLIKNVKKMEGERDVNLLPQPEAIKVFESIKITIKNKAFMSWMIVNSLSFFGLQLFLVSMNSLIVGGMELPNWGMTILNTFAFAPIPLMLYFFYKLKDRQGIRFSYQLALVTFAICILGFFFGSTFFLGKDYVWLQYVIGTIGAIAGSYAIGVFLLMPTMLPAQIGAHQQILEKKNYSAMFFAIQALITSLVAAVSSGFVYEQIKMLFINKMTNEVISAENIEKAAEQFGVDVSHVFNFGLLLIPFIVTLALLIGLIFTIRMPKNYTLREVAEMNGMSEELKGRSELEEIDENLTKDIDNLTPKLVLFFLTASIFGIVWRYEILIHEFQKLRYKKLLFVISLLFPPLFVYLVYKTAKDLGISKKKTVTLTVLACFIVFNFIIYYSLNKRIDFLKREKLQPGDKLEKTAYFSIDLENLKDIEKFSPWIKEEPNFDLEIKSILELLDKYQIRATFFACANYFLVNKEIIATIIDKGHEIGLHGIDHKNETIDPESFKKSIREAKKTIEKEFEITLTSYRAPSFNLTQEIYDTLSENGFTSDSSTFNYRKAFYNSNFVENEKVKEYPVWKEKSYPLAGGAYNRLLPTVIFKGKFLKHIKENTYYNFYVHPYDLSQKKIIDKKAPIRMKMFFSNGRKRYLKKIEWMIQSLLKHGYKFQIYQ